MFLSFKCRDSLAFATEPVLASLANLLGNYDRLPGTAIQDLKVHHASHLYEISYSLEKIIMD